MVDEINQPLRRTGHVAVTYKNCMLVWGGYKEVPNDPINRYLPGTDLWCYDALTEKWFLKKCSSGPPGTSGAAAVTVQNFLYIFGGYRDDGNTSNIYRLNLETLQWEMLYPNGTLPTPTDKMVGWQHNDKLYFFGGFGIVPDFISHRHPDFQFILDVDTPWSYKRGWTNQFVMYDPDNNTWNWPDYKRKAPVARAAHAATTIDNKVYIFGGRHHQVRMNDLHCLDMDTLTWSGMLPTKGPQPEGRSWHSITAVSGQYLILYGGFSQNDIPLSDCWRIDVHTLTWDLIELPFQKPRLWHTACISPFDEVLIYGGCTENILDHRIIAEHAGDIIILRFSPKSLYRLCLDIVVKNSPLLRPHWSLLPYTIQVILQLRINSNRPTSLDGS